ncbi:MAG: hypothetical protein ABJB74_12725 [Gemmatimonas sp.]
MRTFVPYTISIIALFSVVACASDAATGTNDLTNLPEFTLSPSPTFTLRDDGTPNRQFTRISARHLSNGDIALADQGSTRLLIFGRDGQMKKELAHKGSGPGEIAGNFMLTSMGDTLLAFEQSPISIGAVNVFDAVTGFVARISPHAQNYSGRMSALAPLSDRAWTVQRGSLGRAIYSIPAVGEFMPDSQTLGVLQLAATADSSTVTWLPPIVRSWMVVVPIEGATGVNGSPTTLPVPFAFKGSILNTTSNDRLWLVNTISGELVAYDAEGKRVVETTLHIPAKRIEASELTSARNAATANAKNSVAKAAANGRFYAKALPKTLPLFSEIFAGDSGELWLKTFELLPNKAQRFVVVARDGHPIATVVIPAELRLQHIGRDFVLALSADSQGVESVVEYALKR